MKAHPPRPCGFTLIEASAVLAITTILATTAAPGMQALIDARRLDNASAQLASDIHLTRVAAVTRNQPVRLTFAPRSAGSCYVIHTGSANACQCGGEGPAVCSEPAREIKTVVLNDADHVRISANVNSVLFDPLHGTSSPTGTVRVTGAGGREVRYIINIMGRARTCSPSPSVPGYRAC